MRVCRYFERRSLLLDAAKIFENAADVDGVLAVVSLGAVLRAAYAAEFARVSADQGQARRQRRAPAEDGGGTGWPRAEGPSAAEVEECQKQLSGSDSPFHLAGHLDSDHPHRAETVDFLEFQDWWRQRCEIEHRQRSDESAMDAVSKVSVVNTDSAMYGASAQDVMHAAE